MNTEAVFGDDKVYPAPELRVIVAVLPLRPILFTVNVIVAEVPPAGIVN